MIEICAHTSPYYSARTIRNANDGHITVAFAVDFNTAGERLTRGCARGKYLPIPLDLDPVAAARLIYKWLRDRAAGFPVVNVAGNGMSTLAKHRWTQDRANRHVFDALSKVHAHWPIRRVISGGQTGIDMAGIVAAHALGIDARALLPRDFRQRGADGIDRPQDPLEIERVVRAAAAALSAGTPDLEAEGVAIAPAQ